jgi:hypothetical protein
MSQATFDPVEAADGLNRRLFEYAETLRLLGAALHYAARAHNNLQYRETEDADGDSHSMVNAVIGQAHDRVREIAKKLEDSASIADEIMMVVRKAGAQ